MSSEISWRRLRVERGIYLQPNGRYSVCVMIEGRPRFRLVEATSIEQARAARGRPADGSAEETSCRAFLAAACTFR